MGSVSDDRNDQPLPATALFVTLLGIFLVGAWIAMFVLTASRW
jgi:hypothetical protein